MERENINRCLGGLRMEARDERSPRTLLVNYFSFDPSTAAKTRRSVRFQVSFEYRSRIKAAAWTLERKNGNVHC